MRTWAKGAKPAALLAVGVMAFSGNATALADTDGRHSVLGGNQLNLPVTLPVDISGNAIGIAGEATAQSRGGAVAQTGPGGAGGNTTSGRSSVGGGNQVTAPITAPISLCGVAISAFGRAEAGCEGGATARTGSGGSGGAGGNRTDGRGGVLGGNQVTAPVTAPISACGTTVGLLGDAVAGCTGGAKVRGGSGGSGGAGGNRTSGRGGVLGGNQATAPVTAPVSVCGTAVGALGGAFSGCTGGATVKTPKKNRYNYGNGPGGSGGAGGNATDGRFAAGSGNQVIAPILLPVNACGNVVGGGNAACPGGATAAAGGGGQGAGGNTTSGRSSVLGGNQATAPITAPVNVCGTAVGALGDAFAGCTGGAKVQRGSGGSGGAGGNRTDGRSSVLGGNQATAPITAPVNACGIAGGILGRSEAGCAGGAQAAGGGQGAGGNATSGRSSVLGGNQATAPITAPVNACGVTAAVLGDAAAGCLGNAKVGGPRQRTAAVHQSAGLMSVAPLTPAVGGKKDAHRVAPGAPKLPAVSSAGLAPVPGGLPQTPGYLPPVPGGLSPLPNLPFVSAVPLSLPVADAQGAAAKAPKSGHAAAHGKPGGSVLDTAGSLPLGEIGLMSAEQPAGLTGMNAGALLALALGTLFAASATLFAFTRRLRPSRGRR